MILQLRLRFLSVRARGREQPRSTLTLELHENLIDINTLPTSHHHLAADLVEIGEADVARLVEHDGRLHTVQQIERE